MRILITGAAGFIGFSLASRLLDDGIEIVGVDNLNPYYEISLKQARLAILKRRRGFQFFLIDLTDRVATAALFAQKRFEIIIHLAAQAGVRYSIDKPIAYVDANLVGFGNVIEGARLQRVRHFIFASSSSVYGGSRKFPFSETDQVDNPMSLYAATKKANELVAHSYAHLYKLPSTALRFFTVYGPWGRPDMALFKFTRSILAGESIQVYNNGHMVRDFTYIDDAVEAVARLLTLPPHGGTADEATAGGTNAPYRVLNVGNNRPIELLDYIRALEKHLGRKAIMDLLPMQPGDVPATMADMAQLERTIGYRPTTPIDQGIGHFVEWYREYYNTRGSGRA